MIGLHAVPHAYSAINLTEGQITSLGDALMAHREIRIRLHQNGRAFVQVYEHWTREWLHWVPATYWWTDSQRRSRLRRGRQALAAQEIRISRPSEER